MANFFPPNTNDKVEIYRHILKSIDMVNEGDYGRWYSALANISSIIGNCLPDINWAGFYMLKNNQLVLAPFYGKPAVAVIDIGNGVVGTAFAQSKSIIVPDVHAFEGHIACDLISNSEIVIPIYDTFGNIIGILDIDSPVLSRFDSTDEEYLTIVASKVTQYLSDYDIK